MGCLGFLFIGLPGRGGAKRCAWEWHYRLEEKCRDKFESSISLLGISVVYCYGSRMGGVEYIDIFLGLIAYFQEYCNLCKIAPSIICMTICDRILQTFLRKLPP